MLHYILTLVEWLLGGVCIMTVILLIIGWYAFIYSIRYRQMEDE